MLDLTEHENPDLFDPEFLFGHLDRKGIIKTRVQSRPGHTAAGHVVLQRLDIFCEDCEGRITHDAFGPHTFNVITKMRRDYFATRCPECHDRHTSKLEARESLDVGDIGDPGEEVRI